MLMLIFSQSTPLIFMGDEFGNTQKGNNNPYGQDNLTTWLNWNDVVRNKDILDFWKMCISLRKDHPILRPQSGFRLMDHCACGYPDLSYHGQNAWRAQTEGYNRHIGMMLCGKYAKRDGKEDDFFYLAMNMHWEPHMLALPKLPKGLKWDLLCVSGGLQEALLINKSQTEESITKTADSTDIMEEYCRLIDGRSIAVFVSVEDDKTKDNVSGKRSKKKK
jgi:glycogen operon protein